MTRILRQGGILAILVDMARRKDGVEVRFFGKKATATPAVAMLALRCRCAVLPCFCIRERHGMLGIHFEPEIEMRRTNNLRADLVENTQRITDVVERMVRRYPEQWHWLMRRWKDHYPYLYR
jgi:KDO2-lipid IV(A) lauroyltransferase